MRYLEEKPFITATKKNFALEGVKGNQAEKTSEATVSEVLHWLVSSYTPQIAGVLSLQELRKLNSAIDVLENEPANGCYEIETSDFEVIKKVAPKMAVYLSPRNAPVVEDILEAVPSKKPGEEQGS